MLNYSVYQEDFQLQFITWPSIQEIIDDEKTFFKFSNSGVFGRVDECHIKIKAPEENQADYINRKKFHSVNLMDICNSNQEFIHISAGFPGSAHDARVFQHCGVIRSLVEDPDRYLPNGNYHLFSSV